MYSGVGASKHFRMSAVWVSMPEFFPGPVKRFATGGHRRAAPLRRTGARSSQRPCSGRVEDVLDQQRMPQGCTL